MLAWCVPGGESEEKTEGEKEDEEEEAAGTNKGQIKTNSRSSYPPMKARSLGLVI